jgi:cytochrome P450
MKYGNHANSVIFSMALHEMRLILSKVLFDFDLELQPESQDWIAKQKVYTLWEKAPLMVKLKEVGVSA